MTDEQLLQLEHDISYRFRDRTHIETALTHKSFTNEVVTGRSTSYERYEFLGDAILEFITSEFLYHTYPDLPEGKLTKLRASLVCEFTLSKIARNLHFGEYAKFSKGELRTGGPKRDSILCDLFESVLGAIYLDGGLEPSKTYVQRFLLTDIEHKARFYDAKTSLQEYAQKQGVMITYKLLFEEGPEHSKVFHVQAFMGEKALAKGAGSSKKSAEQEAAYASMQMLKINE